LRESQNRAAPVLRRAISNFPLLGEKKETNARIGGGPAWKSSADLKGEKENRV